MGRKKTNKKVMSIRVDKNNEPKLKALVKEKDKELTEARSIRDSKPN